MDAIVIRTKKVILSHWSNMTTFSIWSRVHTLLQLSSISRPTLRGEESHGFSIFSLAIRKRRVLRSRPRISEALFLPLTFQLVCTNT